MRIYLGKNLTELKKILESLRSNLGAGGLEEVQVSGIRTRTKSISHSERINLIYECQMEGFRVASALEDDDPNKAAALLAWPRPEKVMRVESRHPCAVYPSTLP